MPPLVFDPASASAVLQAASFPRSGEPNNPQLIAYAERAVAAWKLRGEQERLHASALADFLYKAAAKTYHSQAILRCLLLVLFALGNYADAERALNTYLDLAEKARVRAEKGSSFVDSDDPLTTVETAAEGVQMIVRCVRDSAKAKEKAEVLRGWIVLATAAATEPAKIESGATTTGKDSSKILAKAWAAVGSAYGLVMRKSLNQKSRDASGSESKQAFETALSLDSDSVEIMYEYALLLAEFYRDLPAAEALCRRALAIDPKHIGSAHVLTLVLSAREKFEEAKEVCLNAVQDTSGIDRRRLTLTDKRAVVQIRMTEVALIESIDGVQAALESVSDSLFAVYNDLFTWDEDTVESQIHEASTSAMAFPGMVEKTRETVKKRSDIVPVAEVPAIPTSEPNNDDDLDEDGDETDGSSPSVDPGAAYNGSSQRSMPTTEKIVLDKIPQDLLTNASGIPSAMLADLRLTSSKSRSVISKRSFILPRAIRRRLSDASIRSKKSSKSSRQPLTAASIIEKNRGGANRVLRNSLSVDDAELKTISMQCLREVWLLVAGLFRRTERWTESAVAIAEATKLGGAKEDTFTERGFLMQAQGRTADALDAFEAALTVSIDYVPAIIGISAVLLNLPSDEQPIARDRAFVLLETATKLEGWDYPEAWMLLGDACDSIGSYEHVREAWWRAAELEESRPVRRFNVAWIWDITH